MPKNVLTVPVSFTGFCTGDEPKFPWQNNLISQKMVWHKQSSKGIKYFSRTLTKFKDLLRRPLNFKTFSRLYEPCTFILLEDFDCNTFAHEHVVLISFPWERIMGQSRQIPSLVLGICEFHHSYFKTNKKIKSLKLIGSWFPKWPTNFYSVFSRENSTVTITISALFALRQSHADLMMFQTMHKKCREVSGIILLFNITTSYTAAWEISTIWLASSSGISA